VSAFKHPALKQLTDQQVRFAPPARRLEQLARAQKLLGEIEPNRAYPYQFVCFRVTIYRPESYPDLLIPGADLAHDLALMIEALGGSAPAALPAEELVAVSEIVVVVCAGDTDSSNVPELGAKLASSAYWARML